VTDETKAGTSPWKRAGVIAALVAGLLLLFVAYGFLGKWAILSWMDAGQKVPRPYRTAAYVGGLVASLAAAFGLPPLRRRYADQIRPEWLGAYASIAAYLFTIVTAIGFFVFALTNCVPGGGTWTWVTVFLALGVAAVALLRAAKG
jgi:divalent metal cation (Fe/Co/Zn/Cd) transporter